MPVFDPAAQLRLRHQLQMTVLLTLAALGALAYIFWSDLVLYWSGPPKVVMREVYEPNPDGPTFDHSTFDSLLIEVVDREGMVNYELLRQEQPRLDAYLQALDDAPFDELGRDEKLALLINAYNAYTLKLILNHWPVDSILDIPPAQRWDATRWRIGRRRFSLAELENKYLRSRFIEPRIHFAINCASVGCPPLRNEAYTGDRLEEQLEEQTRMLHQDPRFVRFDPDGPDLRLTRVYDWYRDDFAQVAGSILGYVAQYVPEVEPFLKPDRRRRGRSVEIEWLPYDWALNDQGRPVEGLSRAGGSSSKQ